MENASGGHASSLSPGMRLDQYELLTEVARAHSQSVWVARVRNTHGIEKLVATKAIGAPLSSDAAFREAFFEEVRKASAITHPNVAQVLDLGEHGDLLYVVREYVDGDPLSELHHVVEKKKLKI